MTTDIKNSQADKQRAAFKAQEMMLSSLQKMNETGYKLKKEAREARHCMAQGTGTSIINRKLILLGT